MTASPENGAIEGPQGRLKRAIEDALLLPGSRDFGRLAAYRRFVDEIVAAAILHRALAPDRSSLAPSPRSTTGPMSSSAARPRDAAARVASSSGKHDQVVNYRHVIHSLRRKPMALLNLVYRDRLFPRSYRL